MLGLKIEIGGQGTNFSDTDQEVIINCSDKVEKG
jgi:hypothetical protein